MSLWEYQRITDEYLPAVIETVPRQALASLSDLLQSALEREAGGDGANDDGSYLWYKQLERDIDGNPFSYTQVLLQSVRRAAEKSAESDPGSVPEIVHELEARQRSSFRRVALHIVRLHADAHPELVRERLLDRALLDSIETWHEWSLLLQERFASLAGPDQLEVLQAITQGPPPPEYLDNDGERRAWIKHWQLRRLAVVRSNLIGESKDLYLTLSAELEEPSDPTVHVHESSVWVGPTSPRDAEAISKMEVKELVDFLRSWKPSGGWRDPTPEGLGRALADALGKSPGRFAAEAHQFIGLEPTYVRSVISGIGQVLRGGTSEAFDWDHVLELCQWAISQPRGTANEQGWQDADPNWIGTRRAVADLLGLGLSSTKNEIPHSEQARVWSLIEELTLDPDPTPDEEERFGSDATEPVTLSINTVRGEAMHAVIRYALWRRRQFDREGATSSLERGFLEMPEVSAVLDLHLNPKVEPSLAVRSVYGQYFPSLSFLDSQWAADSVSRIFPTEDPRLRAAAWGAYIGFTRPFDSVFELLRHEYDRAVMALREEDRSDWRDPARNLPEHLVTFYLRGLISLDELEPFFSNASDERRSQAIDYLGRVARDSTLEEEHVLRLQELWQRRAEATADNVEGSVRELAAFGWWFSADRLHPQWSLDLLIEVLSRIGRIDVEHLVLGRLEALCSDHPLKVVRAVRLLVEGDDEGWRILGSRDELQRILKTALALGADEAAKEAERVVNVLVARGYPDYRSLLEDPPSG